MKDFKKPEILIPFIFSLVTFSVQMFFTPDKYKMIGWTLLLVLILVSVYFIGFTVGKRKFSTVSQPQKDIDAILLDHFKKMKEEKHHAEIVRLGLALSLPLWLSHKYETRKEIGEIFEESAKTIGNIKATVKALIEDIGWMLVELGKYDDAEAILKEGLKLAEDKKFLFLLALGYRYMFSKFYRVNDLKTAEDYLNKAEQITMSLPESEKKRELVAEWHFAKSSFYHKENQFEKALKEIRKAKELYMDLSDQEWNIKIMTKEGEIRLSQGDLFTASSLFTQSLKASEECNFNRQIVKNKIGLAKYYHANRKDERSEKELNEAFKIAELFGMYYEKTIILETRRNFDFN